METRAPYALAGSFALAVIFAGFGFVYWLHNHSGVGERSIYRVRFQSSVSGLLTGAPVQFNGIRVGEVTDLQLNSNNPKEVSATISIASTTPVRADTTVGLDFQGLTGVAVITLSGGASSAPLFQPSSKEPATLVADPAVAQNLTQAARNVLGKAESILSDNAEALRGTLAGLNTFSSALARNSDRIDGIVAGLERMTGAPAKTNSAIYDLTAPRSFQVPDKLPPGQIVVPEPTAILQLDTQKILVTPTGAEGSTFTDVRWSDSLPKLIQARVIQSFENANYGRSINRPIDGLSVGYQLMIDIRSFKASLLPLPVADVEFSAKLISGDGRILDAHIFHVTAPAKGSDAAAIAAAFDQAFGKAVTELISWSLSLI
jgi:phospholipid/cholesterol/gamma-HCH transport system substrate-binding protein